MKSIIKQIFSLVFFIFMTNTYSLKSHNTFNGGCDHHCKNSKINKERINNTDVNKQIKDNYSCLKKSLCRG